MNTGSKILIIGAGPCGLGAGYRLTELGHRNFTILEAAGHVGGLAASFVDDHGFTWDIGGHVLHSHYPYFDRMFDDVMAGEYLTHERESWIRIYDTWVPYPFQNNIHRLPPQVRDECLQGLKKAQGKKRNSSPSQKPRQASKFYAPITGGRAGGKRVSSTNGVRQAPTLTFADWIVESFGEGIAKHFLLPYNRKVWAYPPERMNTRWVGDRVSVVDLERIEENIRHNRDDVSWGPNAVFHFPKTGGTGDIWNRVASRFADSIRLNTAVTAVDPVRKRVRTSTGEELPYDQLLTTMPLVELMGLLSSDGKADARRSLHASEVTIVGLGFTGPIPEHLRTKCWMYFPARDVPFFRATVFSNYSPANAPSGMWSLMTEVAHSAFRPFPTGDIVTRVIAGTVSAGLIQRSTAVHHAWTFHAAYGYPTPTVGRDAYLHRVLPELEENGIASRGRFGAWRYEVSNQDHTFMQGVEWADHILSGLEETTIHHPEKINSRP